MEPGCKYFFTTFEEEFIYFKILPSPPPGYLMVAPLLATSTFCMGENGLYKRGLQTVFQCKQFYLNLY